MIRNMLRQFLGINDIDERLTKIEPKKRGPKNNKPSNTQQGAVGTGTGSAVNVVAPRRGGVVPTKTTDDEL